MKASKSILTGLFCRLGKHLKKGRIFVMALLLAIGFVGCNADIPTEETNLPETQASSLLPTEPISTGNSLIEYDPDRSIYFTCHNYDYDIYFGESCAPFLSFWILSKDALNIDSIQIDIPIQNDYAIFQAECYDEYLGRLSTAGTLDYYTFTPYLYQCYWGTQWSAVYENPDAPLTINTEGKEVSLEEAYRLLEAEDLPKFHVYYVDILFKEPFGGDETFQEIDLTIDDKTYHINIGEIRLHDDPPLNYTCDLEIDESGGITSQHIIVYGTPPMLYNDGIDQLCPAFDFTAPYDMELLDLYLLDSKIEIQDIRLLINSQNGSSMDLYWDTNSPISVDEGDHVQIFVYYRDERQKALDYTAKAWAAIDYECEKGRYSAFSECTLRRELNMYELYAIVFDGVDMASYYQDYYFPLNESWRQDYAS